MKKARWIILLLPLLALFGVIRWKTRQPDYVLRQFIAQEVDQSYMVHRAPIHLATLEAWQKAHVYPQRTPFIEPPEMDGCGPTLLWMTWYPNNRAIIDWVVDSKGYISSEAFVRRQDVRVDGQLSLSDMNRLGKLLLQFPSCVSPAPNAENALLISYRDDNSWQARLYDRRYLPAPVRELLKLPTLQASMRSFQKTEKPDLAP